MIIQRVSYGSYIGVYIYIEKKTSSSKLTKLGKKKLITNNVLVLELDNKGISVKLMGNEIGQASALKMCYASLTKGKMALYSSALITANRLNIYVFLLSELANSQKSMLQEMNGVNSLSTKAFRWVGEMNEISNTFDSQGTTKYIHRGASEMFDLIADSPLGSERPETYDSNRTLDETINVLSTVLNKKKQ